VKRSQVLEYLGLSMDQQDLEGQNQCLVTGFLEKK